MEPTKKWASLVEAQLALVRLLVFNSRVSVMVRAELVRGPGAVVDEILKGLSKRKED